MKSLDINFIIVQRKSEDIKSQTTKEFDRTIYDVESMFVDPPIY